MFACFQIFLGLLCGAGFWLLGWGVCYLLVSFVRMKSEQMRRDWDGMVYYVPTEELDEDGE